MFLLARTFLFYKRCACNCFNSGYEAVKTSALLLSVSSVFLRNIFDGVTQTCDNFPLVIIMPEFSSDTVRYTFCDFQKYVLHHFNTFTYQIQGIGKYGSEGIHNQREPAKIRLVKNWVKILLFFSGHYSNMSVRVLSSADTILKRSQLRN